MLETENWKTILKSHLYSRKEYKNGAWHYYYDKNSSFNQLKQCNAVPLKINNSMSPKVIVELAEKYLTNVWIKDWKQHPDKSICKELKNKRISFESISFEHIKKMGGNTSQKRKYRTTQNLVSHVKYLPCAKELLESNGIKTQSRYKVFDKPQKDNSMGYIYQTISGLAPKGDRNNYVQVTVSQKKYKSGNLGNTVYISVVGTKSIKKSTATLQCLKRVIAGRTVKDNTKLTPIPNFRQRNPTHNHIIHPIYNEVNKILIKMDDITEENKLEKLERLDNTLSDILGYDKVPKFVNVSNTKQYPDFNLKIKGITESNKLTKLEKAIRTMSFALDVPLKAAKGEAFMYKAQEDLTDKWTAYFSQTVKETYNFIISYFGLPEITVMSKADNLVYKGKILYSPETGDPIKLKDWETFVKNLEKFLNRKTATTGNKIILESNSLGKILDRMLKYNTLDTVKNARLTGLKYHGKTFDWITDSVKNMQNALGETLSRNEQARIQVMTQSAAQRITKCTETMKADVLQILIDGVKNRSGKSKISQNLFDKMVGSNRDFQRIADTEIQNAVNHSVLQEEVYNAPKGEKVYFQRVEILDDNTCDFCRKMNGVIALWSDTPLADDKVKDTFASVAIWDGKEWDGKKNMVSTGVFHPYCRGVWRRWTEDDNAVDALVEQVTAKGNKWKSAVETAKKEFNDKGIKNPDDNTKGYTERIQELFNESMNKSLTL